MRFQVFNRMDRCLKVEKDFKTKTTSDDITLTSDHFLSAGASDWLGEELGLVVPFLCTGGLFRLDSEAFRVRRRGKR